MNINPAQARTLAHGNPTQIRHPHRTILKPQRVITVRGTVDGKPTTLRAVVLTARTALAGELTFEDARGMGYRTTQDAKAAWVREHDRAWIKRHKLYLLDREEWAELLEDEHGCQRDRILTERFDTHHAHQLIQVATIQHVVDEPRFLARPGRGILTPDGNADYTRTRGLAVDDLEAVDEATQERLAAAAQAHALAQREAQRAQAHAQRPAVIRSQQRLRMFHRAARRAA